jgi:hypothetical protein
MALGWMQSENLHLSAPLAKWWWDRIVFYYSQLRRHYHNLNHLADLVQVCGVVCNVWLHALRADLFFFLVLFGFVLCF